MTKGKRGIHSVANAAISLPGQRMSDPPRNTRAMKQLLSTWANTGEVLANFGAATLRRHRDGRFELHGGTHSDHLAALEWASLFQHDAVFSHRPDRARSALPAPSPRW